MIPCPRNGCCGGDTPACTAECLCSVIIQVPEPDIVDEASGPSCPPADCNIAAKCWGCYQLLDGLWTVIREGFYPNRRYIDVCSGTDYTVELRDLEGDCEYRSAEWGDRYPEDDELLPCWTANNYECPECNDEGFLQCGSMYGLRGFNLLVEETCVDDCCEVTVTITYTVYQYCDELVVIPDPPLSPETEYVHTFSVSDICSCEEMDGAVLSYVSTTSSNNGRGITVPDVCNIEGATISLRSLGTDRCGTCICFGCFDFETNLNLTISGAEFSGTVVCIFDEFPPGQEEATEQLSVCYYDSGTIQGATCEFTIRVRIVCLPCEKYNIYILVGTTDSGTGLGYNYEYELLATDCGTLSGFTCVTDPPTSGDFCDLTDLTLSLS